MSEGVCIALVAAAFAIAACGGERRNDPPSQPEAPGREQRRAAPGTAASQPPARRGRGDRPNDEEAAELVAEALRRRVSSVRCQVEHEAAYSFNRYRCRQAARRFVVRWQQYGSGQYSVTELTADGPRVLARGVASFGG